MIRVIVLMDIGPSIADCHNKEEAFPGGKASSLLYLFYLGVPQQ